MRPYLCPYDVAEVERHLPLIWLPREYAAMGPQDELQPAPDMPRSKPVKGSGFATPARVADLARAWRLAPLTLKQRQALILVYGLGYTNDRAGAVLGVGAGAVSARKCGGVDVLVAWLNGSSAPLGEDEEA